MQNKGMTQEDEASDEEDESEEETLTPGDLMAFAWQISEGMVRLLLCSVTAHRWLSRLSIGLPCGRS